jgi:outer membrane lipoprotein SlyB
MTKLFIWIGVFVGGWLGWFLGDLIGGFGWAFAISSIGSIAGVIIGWKIANYYF